MASAAAVNNANPMADDLTTTTTEGEAPKVKRPKKGALQFFASHKGAAATDKEKEKEKQAILNQVHRSVTTAATDNPTAPKHGPRQGAIPFFAPLTTQEKEKKETSVLRNSTCTGTATLIGEQAVATTMGEEEEEKLEDTAPTDITTSQQEQGAVIEHDKHTLPPGASPPGAYLGAQGGDYQLVAPAPMEGLRGSLLDTNPPDSLTGLPSGPNDDDSATQDASAEDKWKRQARIGAVVLVVLLLLFLTLAIAIPLGIAGGDKGDGEIVDASPPLELNIATLPNADSSTWEAIEDDQSPQYKAYQWLLQDPYLEGYEPWEREERFALVVFYYSFGGPKWVVSQHRWLSYNESICHWMEVARVCFDDGHLVRIVVRRQRGFKGSIPPELLLLSKLEALDFSENIVDKTLADLLSLSEDHPSYLPDSLQLLYCENCRISGEIPSTIAQLSNFIGLFLAENDMVGTVPTEIGMLSRLLFWNMRDNGISGSMPSEVGQLTRLKHWDFFQNRLQDLPSEVGHMTLLEHLDMDSNGLETVPRELAYLPNLETINFGKNNIQGPIPIELTLLNTTNFKQLRLDSNRITGTIPSEIGLLTALVGFYLDNNGMSGTVPTEIGLLTSLRRFFASLNELSSKIPTEVGLLTALTVLDLESNLLSGNIPSEIGLLTAMTWLSLEENSLSGSIPSSLCFNKSYGDIQVDCEVACACSACECVGCKLTSSFSNTDLCGQ